MKKDRKISQSFGAYIRSLRENKGLTLQMVENNTGISKSYLCRIENGVKLAPTVGILGSLSKCYQVSPVDLFKIAMSEYISDTGEDNEELLFETVIYDNNFIVSNKEVNEEVKQVIVNLVKCVYSLNWNDESRYNEIGKVLENIDKFKQAIG